MTRSCGVPLRGFGSGLAASGPVWAGSYGNSVGAGWSGVGAIACTNRRGWPGYRWGRGPDWATTGVIRPVTEIARRVEIAVHHFAGLGADELFVDAAFADQSAWCAVGLVAAVVDLARGEPAIRHRQHRAVESGFVGQLWGDRAHRCVGHGSAERPSTHALFHGGHVKVFDHEVAISARQLGGELVGGFPP